MTVAAQPIQPAFEWEFLRTLVRWSVIAALTVGAIGVVLTRDVSFALSFALAAAIDVGSMQAVITRGRGTLEGGAPVGSGLGLLVSARLALKAALLVLAALLPSVSLLGVALGVLVVDTTVLVGGSVAAGTRTFGGHGGGSAGPGGPETGE
jgi:hypothetical protein